MEIQWPLLIFSVLLGVTSGSFVFLAVGELRGEFRDVRFAGALIALICLAVGGCVSVLHMGHPERATHLLGNLGSGLSKELFVVAIMGIVALIYLVLAKKDYPTASKVSGVLIMAVTTVAYVIWIAVAPYQAPTRSIERLISGDMAVMFWAGVVVIGIVVPVALTALACVQSTKGAGDSGTVQPKQLAMYLFAACACSAIGAVVLRVIMYGVGTSVEQFIYR